MTKGRKAYLLIAAAAIVSGCASSMPATQFYQAFPAATETQNLTGAEASLALGDGSCIQLGEHMYAAPVGLTVQEDVKNGAEGVDFIVGNEGGNAYRITGYSWVTLPDLSTQLQVNFASLFCTFGQPSNSEDTST